MKTYLCDICEKACDNRAREVVRAKRVYPGYMGDLKEKIEICRTCVAAIKELSLKEASARAPITMHEAERLWKALGGHREMLETISNRLEALEAAQRHPRK